MAVSYLTKTELGHFLQHNGNIEAGGTISTDRIRSSKAVCSANATIAQGDG